VDLLLSRVVVTQGVEKAEVLNAFFTSVFTGKICFQKSQSPETSGSICSNGDLPLVKKIRTFKQIGHKRVDGTQCAASISDKGDDRCH